MRRIIPARAGFTRWPVCWLAWLSDHPRSRGVYHLLRSICMIRSGSSPLARGLLAVLLVFVVPERIIPARAGFTLSEREDGEADGDHPRSRGVYPSSLPATVSGPGSSPLARGLQASDLPESAGRRIIPARAGFTRTRPASMCGITDHPRSRGVYCAWCSMLASRGGSSPLARGLPGVLIKSTRPVRIIPARAGFTRIDL